MKKQHVILPHDQDEVIQLRSGVDFREKLQSPPKFISGFLKDYWRAVKGESTSNPV